VDDSVPSMFLFILAYFAMKLVSSSEGCYVEQSLVDRLSDLAYFHTYYSYCHLTGHLQKFASSLYLSHYCNRH